MTVEVTEFNLCYSTLTNFMQSVPSLSNLLAMDCLKIPGASFSSLACIVDNRLASGPWLVSLKRKTFISSLATCSLCKSWHLCRYDLKSSLVSLTPLHNSSRLFHPLKIASAALQTSEVFNCAEAENGSTSDQFSSSESDSEDCVNGINDESKSVEDETLGLLEWPKICNQVSQFVSTPMGLKIVSEGSLPIGATAEESEELQSQTSAAKSLSIPLNFSNIEDLRETIGGALAGNVCQLDELCRVKRTLSSVRRLRKQLFGNSGDGSSPSHQQHKQGMVVHELHSCL